MRWPWQHRSALEKVRGTIVIVTYGRSGSTLLQALLNDTPGVHISGEAFGSINALYMAAARVRKAKEVWGKIPRGNDHPWFGADRLDTPRFEQRLAEAYVDEVICPPKTARWIGFKEIRFQPLGDDLPDMLAFLRRVFPNLIIVFNSREAGAVARSKWWADQDADEVRAMVARLDARFGAYAAAHPDHAVHLFHENTVADVTSLSPLFDLIGEPLDAARLTAILTKELEH